MKPIKPEFKGLNPIEVAYEIPMTLDKLMEIQRAIEFLHKNAKDGQTVRYKVDHNFAFVVKREPVFDHSKDTIREYVAPPPFTKDHDIIQTLPNSAMPPEKCPKSDNESLNSH